MSYAGGIGGVIGNKLASWIFRKFSFKKAFLITIIPGFAVSMIILFFCTLIYKEATLESLQKKNILVENYYFSDAKYDSDKYMVLETKAEKYWLRYNLWKNQYTYDSLLKELGKDKYATIWLKDKVWGNLPFGIKTTTVFIAPELGVKLDNINRNYLLSIFYFAFFGTIFMAVYLLTKIAIKGKSITKILKIPSILRDNLAIKNILLFFQILVLVAAAVIFATFPRINMKIVVLSASIFWFLIFVFSCLDDPDLSSKL